MCDVIYRLCSRARVHLPPWLSTTWSWADLSANWRWAPRHTWLSSLTRLARALSSHCQFQTPTSATDFWRPRRSACGKCEAGCVVKKINSAHFFQAHYVSRLQVEEPMVDTFWPQITSNVDLLCFSFVLYSKLYIHLIVEILFFVVGLPHTHTHSLSFS